MNSTRSGEPSAAAQGAHPGRVPLSDRGGVVPWHRDRTIEVPGGSWLVVLLGIGVLISLAGCARLVRSLHRLRALKRASLPLPAIHAAALEPWVRRARTDRAVELRVSARIAAPIAVGYLHPAILLPSSLLERLTEEELAHVVLHEIAHVHRRDDWSLLAQRLVQAVLFFHPAVHWIGRRLEFERELACDQFVLESSPSAARSYARCLVRLAELVVASRHAGLAPGAVPRTSQLGHRLQVLLSTANSGDTRAPRAAAIAGGTLLLAAAVSAPHLAPTVALRVPEQPGASAAAAPPMLAAVRAFPAAVPPAGSVASRAGQSQDTPAAGSRLEQTAVEMGRRMDIEGSARRSGLESGRSEPIGPGYPIVAGVESAALWQSPPYLDPVEMSNDRAASLPPVQERPASRRGPGITISLAVGGVVLDPLRVLTEPIAAGALPYPYGGQPVGAVRGYPERRPGLPAAGGVRLRVTGGSAVPRPYPGLLQR